MWAKSAGGVSGIDTEIGYGISTDASGNSYLAGYFRSVTITFGTFTLTSAGSSDFFISKLSSICNLSPSAICLVIVDTLSKYNNIVWDKTQYTNVDSFIIFREITTNNYQPIGAVSYDSLSLFIDTVRTKYFPNTGDPNGGTYRYKIQLRDTCGNYSALSPYHNTIYMTNNSGNFSWPQLYTIEGGPNPVSNYLLMRDDFNNGNWNAVNSVSGSQQSITDPAYAAWAATANWRIETIWNITCTPTIKNNPSPLAINKTRSNSYKPINPVNVSETLNENSISIFPNPSTGKFIAKAVQTVIKELEILDIMGGKIYFTKNVNAKSFSFDLNICDGVYFLKIFSSEGMVIKKIIISHK